MQVDLVVDGMIATTHIVERLLTAAFGSVRTIPADNLHATRPDGELLVLSRLCSPRLAWLPDYFAGRGQPYAYFLDDNLLELSETQDLANAAYYGHPAVREGLLKFLSNAAVVWVMSPTLQTYLRDRLALGNVQYLPAPVDVQLFARGDEMAPRNPQRKVIGYPTSRRLHVAGLLTDIVNLASRRFGDRVHFEFVGWCPESIVGHRNVSSIPHIAGYEEFARFVATRQWTAALAPVSDSLFENCKTSVKFREYGAAKVPGIYSDTPLYNDDVRHEQSGMLVENNATAWVDAIERLVDDEPLRQRIVEGAHEHVLRAHEQGVVARQTRAMLSAFARDNAVSVDNRQDR